MEQHYNEVAQICLNGDLITDNFNKNQWERSEHCPKCGASTITKCPHCQTPIKGCHRVIKTRTTSINVISHESTYATYDEKVEKYNIPAYCQHCGEPFPWTQTAIESASKIIDEEMNELNGEEKSNFKTGLPDIIAQTLRTTLAATRIDKYLGKVKPIAKESFKQIFYRIAAEGAKILIWGA